MSDEKRIDVTPAQLVDIAKRTPGIGIGDLKVEGIAVIKDKDGNIKGKMQITNRVENDEAK